MKHMIATGLAFTVLFPFVVRAADETPSKHAEGSGSRKISLQLHNAPWPDVLELVAKSADVPLEIQSTPSGTFTYEGSNPHTLSEVISLVNRALMEKSHLLIERNQSLLCVNFENSPIPASAIPDISVADLKSRGDYELVSVTFALSGANLGQVAEDVSKVKGPFGSVVTLPSTNSIRVTDLAVNLHRIAKLVKDVPHGLADAPPTPKSLDAAGQKVRLVIVGDGGATTEADKEKVKKLVSEGVLKQIEPAPNDFIGGTAEIMFQPKVAADHPGARAAARGAFLAGASPDVANLANMPINPKWDDALRALSKQGVDQEVRVRFYTPATAWNFVPNADVRVIVPVDSTHTLSDAITTACEKSGLVVDSKQSHPFFGLTSIPKGKELYPVYANESGSPSAILQNNGDLLDLRLILEEGSGFRGTFGRSPTMVERAACHIIQNAPKEAGGRRVVGVLVTPEDGRLLRAAEREGRLEAFRRDPTDSSTNVTPDLRRRLVAAFLPEDAPTSPEVTSSSAISKLKIVQLQHARAAAMATLLSQVVRREGFSAIPDERTNAVILSVDSANPSETDSELLRWAEELLAKLDSARPAPRTAGNPLARLPGMDMGGEDGMGMGMSMMMGMPSKPVKPLAELQRAYADREAAAAKQARQLREFVEKRRPGLSEKDFKQEEKYRREQLAAAVKESFNARQAMLAAELEGMQEKIASTRRSLELRSRATDEIVARRVEDLLNPEFKWDEPQVAGDSQALTLQAATSQITSPGPVVQRPGSTRPAQPAMKPADAFSQSGLPAGIKSIDELLKGSAKSVSNPIAELTGIWESYDGTEMMGGMGMAGAYGGEAMMGIGSGSGPRLVIDGDCAALYEKNERQRLWTITVDQPSQSWMRVTFTPLDGQAGMQGSFLYKEKSLTVVSSGDEGAKIVRYHRSIAAVPPDWAKQMQEAAGEKRAVNVPDGFRLRPRADLSTAPPAGGSDVLSNLAGIWATTGGMGMGGMGMGGSFGAMPGDSGDKGSRQQAFLVINANRAALYEKNERQRLWTISIDQSDENQARLNFIAQDGQAGMQGTYSLKGGSLSVVSTGEEGPKIVQYRRTVPVVPPEWAKEMGEAAGAGPSQSSIGVSAGPGPGDDFRAGPLGAERAAVAFARASAGQRQPSDYLGMLEKYGVALAEYNKLLETFGKGHPQVRKVQRERARELQAVDIIQKEYQAELEEAARVLELKREEAAVASETLSFIRRQVEKGTTQKTELERQRALVLAAETALRSAESRLKLFESTKDSLFPSDATTPGARPEQKTSSPVPAGSKTFTLPPIFSTPEAGPVFPSGAVPQEAPLPPPAAVPGPNA